MLYIGTLIQCRPLREVVSWNLHCHAPAPFLPRSTSSWGRELKYWRHYLVEGHCVSTSSWGRELKFCVNITSSCYSGRPLREVVSWNTIYGFFDISWKVDLFVRSWVEIFAVNLSTSWLMSTSSWGRELKWKPHAGHFRTWSRPLREVVSWNEMTAGRSVTAESRPLREVVSWNTWWIIFFRYMQCRPLREVVSWNRIPDGSLVLTV